MTAPLPVQTLSSRRLARAGRSYTTAVRGIHKALLRANHCQIDMYLKVQRVESSGKWKSGECPTFGDFLRTEFPTWITVRKYNHALRAIALYGEPTVRRFGLPAMTGLAIAQPFEQKRRLRDALVGALSEEMDALGVPPDARCAYKLATRIAPELERAPRTTVATRQNMADRAELIACQVDIESLENEVARLKSRLAAADRTVALYKKTFGPLPKKKARKPAPRAYPVSWVTK